MDDDCDFTSFSAVFQSSGRWAGDNERLCAMEPIYEVEKISPRAGLESGMARSVGQHLTTELQGLLKYSITKR